jgi:hypothetical protein
MKTSSLLDLFSFLSLFYFAFKQVVAFKLYQLPFAYLVTHSLRPSSLIFLSKTTFYAGRSLAIKPAKTICRTSQKTPKHSHAK